MKNPLKANIPPKKLLSIGFVAMLLLTIAMVMVPASVAAVPSQSIWIDPTYPDPSVTDLNVSDTFTVDVMVNVTSPTSPGGTGMFAFEYTLFWNDSYITLTSRDTHNPAGWEPPAGFLAMDETGVWDKEAPPHLRPKKGLCYHWYGYSSITAPVFTGVMSLCTYTFTVTDQPIDPAPAFNGTLELEEVKIVDNATVTFIANRPGQEAGTVQDAMYEVASRVLTDPLLKVEPSLVEGVFGQNFTVNIWIEGLDAALNLSSWEAMLDYNTTMLDALVSAEGPFLAGFAGTNGTYYESIIDEPLGIVEMEGGFNGSYTEPSGSGVLATVTFNASWRYTIPPGVPPVSSALNLYNTILLDGAGLPITHDATDGTYKAPFKDEKLPTIEIPVRDPAGDVQPMQSVYISVNVSDAETGVKNVTLKFNNGTLSIELGMTELTPGTYVTYIEGQPAFTTVRFNITAYDNAENVWTRDGVDVHFVYTVVPEFPAALIVPLFMIAALVAVILGKAAWSRKRRSPFVASRT